MPLDTLDTTLVSKHPMTPRMTQFVLDADGHVFDHAPGHHVSVAYRSDEDGLVVRPYSPVSRPGTNRIVLAVKRYDEGTCSVWLHEREPGDTVPLTDPSGNLHLHDLDRDALFVSTGTGITPMIAMLKQYLDEGTGQATFVFGERTEADLAYRETLDHLAADTDRLRVAFVLSGDDWHGRTGYVQDHLPDLLNGAAETGAAETGVVPHAYLCGVPEMVVETTSLLTGDLGFPDDAVFSEGWEDGAVE